MVRSTLLTALGLALAAPAVAQDYDDRWYVAPRIGAVFADDDRETDNSPFGGIGFGRFFSRNWAVDAELMYHDFERKADRRAWRHTGIGLTARYFIGESDGPWRPYLMAGVHGLRSSLSGGESGTNLGLLAGGGISHAVNDRITLRGELGYRLDKDADSFPAFRDYGDWIVSAGFTYALGEAAAPAPTPAPTPAPAPRPAAPTPAPAPAPVAPPCPPARPGQIIGPDGCPVDVTIDLRGVQFDFDSNNLRPQSITTLNEGVEILKRFPTIRVEVAGHTCNIGSGPYNQGLSERRARAVYDYLVNNGIDANRLRWAGYGLTRPIADNGSNSGREQNRRTELVILN